jgi:hypothetical protein
MNVKLMKHKQVDEFEIHTDWHTLKYSFPKYEKVLAYGVNFFIELEF